MASSGIWNHTATSQALSRATPMDSPSGSTADASSNDSATISANDFLTLLVTEMQNQDPTADTDPNEYINQLVNVNSLEQLISINQTLTTDSEGTAPTTGGVTQPTNTSDNSKVQSAGGAHVSSLSPVTASSSGSPNGRPPAAHVVPGNLNIPETSAAAQRVAQSLNGRPPAI